jgi:hypothetical protein
MSNLGFQTANLKLVPVSTADFGVLTFASGTLTGFKTGEKISGGTSGATARVSGVISATELRIKAVKPNGTTGALFVAGETITGATSTVTGILNATQATAYAQKRKQLRYDSTAPTLATGNVTFALTGNHITFTTANSTGTTGMAPGAQFIVSGANAANNQVYTVLSVVSGVALTVTPAPGAAEGPIAAVAKGLRYLVSFNSVSADDKGLSKTGSHGLQEVTVAARMMMSKSQVTDTSVAPVYAWTIPAAGNYSVAGAGTMRFTMALNESVTVVGAPRVAIVDVGSAHTVYATYNPIASDADTLVFDYVLGSSLTSAGQIVSVAYNANGATITDIGGAALVPTISNSVTGILITA